MNDQFKRILNLVKRTGDRMVVTDPDGKNAFVIMGVEQYEEIFDTLDCLGDDCCWDGDEDEDFDEYVDEGYFEGGYAEMIGDDFPVPEIDLSEEQPFEEEYLANLSQEPQNIPIVEDKTAPRVEKVEIWDAMKGANEDGETWNLEQMTDGEAKEVQNEYKRMKQSPQSGYAPEHSEESGQKDDEDLGEEQFYLEPVE